MDQEPQPNEQMAGDRLLETLGIDPDKWTVGDRRIALGGIGIGLAIVIIAVCGYVFNLPWTGLAKRTFWDWLNLLIVPIVLALGGYLFTRSENRRTKDDADRQRALDRELADERRQDDMLQAYLDGMSQLLTDKDRPLHRAQSGDSLSTVARARTLTVLTRLNRDRKGSVVRFLHDAGLIAKDRPILNLRESDLTGANLFWSNLSGADLSGAFLNGALLVRANLSGADLSWGTALSGANLLGADLRRADLRGAYLWEANLRGADLLGADLRGAQGLFEAGYRKPASLEGATMPNGQKYEDWLKSEGGGKDGENGGPS